MQRKSLIAAALAAAFAFPLAANAGDDKPASAKWTSPTNGATNGSDDMMFKAADKNSDGFISMEEATGTPHSANFASLDKDRDGQLSREELSSANDHVTGHSATKVKPVTTGTPTYSIGN